MTNALRATLNKESIYKVSLSESEIEVILEVLRYELASELCGDSQVEQHARDILLRAVESKLRDIAGDTAES